MNMDSRSIFLIVFLVCHSSQKVSKNFAGPFSVIVQQIEKCEDEGTRQLRLLDHRISRISRTKFSYSGRAEFELPMDEKMTVSLQMKIDISVWGNGGWKPNYFQKDVPDPCNQAKTASPNFLRNALRSGNITDCPIPAGSFFFKDLILEPDLNTKALPYNKHRVDASFWVGGTKVGCESIYFDIVRKISKSKP